MQLPTKKELPDYYEVIDRPMDFNKIKRKIKEGRYKTINDMGKDVNLLCQNAQQYNQDGSEIHNDSLLLQSVWETAKKRTMAEPTSSGQCNQYSLISIVFQRNIEFSS
jgi:SWI/SNF-related matrix-associated actin-dependent regulator of chromatin subfamily A protein 2/4